MRYFTGPSQLFDAIRQQVMESMALPSGTADQPWPQGATTLALAPHEYEPENYQALITYALANGAQELTDAQYLATLPPSPEL